MSEACAYYDHIPPVRFDGDDSDRKKGQPPLGQVTAVCALRSMTKT